MKLVKKKKKKKKKDNNKENKDNKKNKDNNEENNNENKDNNAKLDFIEKKVQLKSQRKNLLENEPIKFEGNFTGEENSNENKLKSVNQNNNLKNIQREYSLNNNEEEENDDEYEYYYDLVDFNEELKKRVQLSNLVKKKISYPIQKCFNHWKEIAKYEKKITELKDKYMNSVMKNLENVVIDKNKKNRKSKFDDEKLSQSHGQLSINLNQSQSSFKDSQLSSSSKTSMNVRRNLKATIGITMLKKLFKKIVIRKYFEEFVKKYCNRDKLKYIKKVIGEEELNKIESKKVLDLLNMLTSPDFNLFSSIIKLTEESDKNILNIIGKKAKKNYYII